jgi:hypothetical protein
MSPAQTVIANPDPQLSGPSGSSPFVTRPAPERSASKLAPSPATSSGKKTLLIVVAAVAVAVLVIVLASGGSSTGGGGY